MNTKSINNTDNTKETISTSSDFASPDEETISRAILTFCLEGVDAIMYTLLLGSKSAKEIVFTIKNNCEKLYETTINRLSSTNATSNY